MVRDGARHMLAERLDVGSDLGLQAEVLPLLYLHGLSSGDFGPALEQFLGSGAGLSAAKITRLTKDWQDEAVAFNKRPLGNYVLRVGRRD